MSAKHAPGPRAAEVVVAEAVSVAEAEEVALAVVGEVDAGPSNPYYPVSKNLWRLVV